MSYLHRQVIGQCEFGWECSRQRAWMTPTGFPMLQRDSTCMTLWDWNPHG